MVAEKSVKELENSQMALTITVDAESLEKAYSAKLAKYAKDIQLNGFRKGKAPVSMIESKFGTAIREETTFDTMEEHLKEAIETLEDGQKPLPYSTPVLQEEEKLLPFKKDTAVTFTVVYDVMPKFDLPAYTGLEVEVNDAEVTDADIEARVEELREQNAMVIAKDGAAAKGDIVTVNYVELDKDGAEVAGTSRKDFTFTLGSTYNFYAFDEEIVGMAKGEEKKFEKTYAEDYENKDYAGKTITLLVNVTEVKVRELPEVDDEFAQDVKEEYKSVADLKAGIKADMTKELENHTKNDKIEALVKAILANTEITVPASMIKAETESNWRNTVKNSGLSEEQLLQYFSFSGKDKEAVLADWAEPAKENIKSQLLLEAVQKKENFPVDEEKIEKELSEQLKEGTDEATRDYYKQLLKDEEQFKQVIPFLLEKNTFKCGKKLSFAEYHAQAR